VTSAGQPGDGGDFVGPWYAWQPGDPLPTLPPLPGFTAAPADDDRALAALARLGIDEMMALRHAGNRPYIVRLAGELVAHGWSTDSTVEIGELGLRFTLPPGERYLWGFATEERWRGRGVYPRLLQAILRLEEAGDARYWIGHEPDNAASARGILRAGFRRVGDVFRLPTGRLALVPVGPIERARVGAALLGADLRADGDSR
jgi:RimJ/RimL family protein N-acetyltransferase